MNQFPNNLKIVYVESRPHRIHQAFAESVDARYAPYLLSVFDNTFVRRRPLLHQFFSLFSAFFIPKADVYIVDSSFKMLPLAVRLLFCKNKPPIIALNADSFYRDFPKDRKFVRRYKRWLMRYVSGMISVTGVVKEFSTPFITVPSEIVYPYFNIDRFKPLITPHDSNHILTLGGPSHVKGSDILVEAFSIYQQHHPDALLYIVGHGDWLEQYKKRSMLNVRVTGYSTEPYKYMESCGIYVQPSRADASGTAVLEAMYAGFVPVVSEFVGFKELVQQVHPDFVVPLDTEMLAAQLIKMKTGEYDLVGLGQKAHRIACEYTRENQMKRFREAVASILNDLDKPAVAVE